MEIVLNIIMILIRQVHKIQDLKAIDSIIKIIRLHFMGHQHLLVVVEEAA
jgi:hypothetical protein